MVFSVFAAVPRFALSPIVTQHILSVTRAPLPTMSNIKYGPAQGHFRAQIHFAILATKQGSLRPGAVCWLNLSPSPNILRRKS